MSLHSKPNNHHHNHNRNITPPPLPTNNNHSTEHSSQNENEHCPFARSVREYAYHETKNSREHMQDLHKIIDKYTNDNSKGLFTLYDGHGPNTTHFTYARDRLPELFARFLKKTRNNIEQSFIFTLQQLDDEIRLFRSNDTSGSTITIVYIYKDVNGSTCISCANLGDTKAIVVQCNNTYKVITTEHKCTNDKEVQRIKKLGGMVFNSRLFGQLALSRALGDYSLKPYGLSATPSMYKYNVSEKDTYVVIASDGVWDVVSEEEVSKMCNDVNRKGNCKIIAKDIVDMAIAKGSSDNISVIVIRLN